MSFINTVFGIPLGYVMWGCYQLVKNYGLSIILFTLVSKIVMLPVSIMVQKNSIRMIQIQPQINDISMQVIKIALRMNRWSCSRRHIIVQCLVWCQCYYRFHWFLA